MTILFKMGKLSLNSNKPSRLIVCILAISTILFSIFKPIVLAQTGTPIGISITPPTQNITITQDQSSYRLTLILTNHTNERVDLDMSAQDFGALEEGGGVLFLGTSPNDKWENHRLARWMDIKPKQFKLDPQEQAEVVVEIKNDETLAPGGHYAAIFATVASKSEKSYVAINQSLSSLLFINKIGGETFKLEAERVDAETAWWGQVEGVTATLSNTGNAHVVPRGTVSLQDPFGRIVSEGIVNQTSTILLPGTENRFDANLSQTSLPLWPGMYTLVLAYRYDGQDFVVTTEEKVFSIGIVASGVIVLASAAAMAWIIKRQIMRRNQTN